MGTDERTYAAAILKVCGFCRPVPAGFLAGIGVSDLARRIERILNRPPATATLRARAMLPALLTLTIAAPIGVGCASAGRAAQVYRVGDENVQPPILLVDAKPAYTASAMRERIEGTVGLEAVVLASGSVGEVRVLRSLDEQHGLDAQAVAAARQWEFRPGTHEGRPVAVRVSIDMAFTLR